VVMPKCTGVQLFLVAGLLGTDKYQCYPVQMNIRSSFDAD
jgi:hypothetical protein